MKFRKIQPYGPDSYDYWVNGIYKIVSYKVGIYYAYFMRDVANNWGDYVSPPPDHKNGSLCWSTLRSAKAAIGIHARTHTPSPATVKKAAEITRRYLEKQELNTA